jgi:O-acetyl-ADP-ribose deacetylase (regulator of RNase III)
MFPNARAAEIAVDTLEKYRKETGSSIKVVFNVFKDEDERLYRDNISTWRGLSRA